MFFDFVSLVREKNVKYRLRVERGFVLGTEGPRFLNTKRNELDALVPAFERFVFVIFILRSESFLTSFHLFLTNVFSSFLYKVAKVSRHCVLLNESFNKSKIVGSFFFSIEKRDFFSFLEQYE